MAWDTRKNRGVMFGGMGAGGAQLAEVWRLAQAAWSSITPSRSPLPRTNATFTYDAYRGRSVLFGGQALLGPQVFADTWEWDGLNWLRVAPVESPPPLRDHAATFDAARGRVVIFGGVDGAGSLRADLWELASDRWLAATPSTKPAARVELRARVRSDPPRAS